MTTAAVLEIRAGEAVAAAHDFLEQLARDGLDRLERAMPGALRILVTDQAFAPRLGDARERVVGVPAAYWEEGAPYRRVFGNAAVRGLLEDARPDHVVVVPGSSADRSPEELASALALLRETGAELVAGAVELRDNPCQMKLFFRVEDVNLLHPVRRTEQGLLTGPHLAPRGRERLLIGEGAIPADPASVLAVAVDAEGRPAAWVTAADAGPRLRLRAASRDAVRSEVRLFPGAARVARVASAGGGAVFTLPGDVDFSRPVPYVHLTQSGEMETDFWELVSLTREVAGVDEFSGKVVNLGTNAVIRGRQDFPEILAAGGAVCAFRRTDPEVLAAAAASGRGLCLPQSGVNAFYDHLVSMQRAGAGSPELPRAEIWPAGTPEPEPAARRSPEREAARLNTVRANALGALDGEARAFFGKRLAASMQTACARMLDREARADKGRGGLLAYVCSFGRGALGKPVSVMRAGDGSLLVADQSDHKLQVFSPNFVPVRRIGLGLHCPEHFFLDKDGAPWLCDWRNGRLAEVPADDRPGREIDLAAYLPEGEAHRYPASACLRGEEIVVVATADSPYDKRILGIRPGRPAETVVYDSSLLLTPKALAATSGGVVAGDFDFPSLCRLDAGSGRFTPFAVQAPGLIRSLAEWNGLLFVSSLRHLFVYDERGERVDTLDLAALTGEDDTSLRDIWVDGASRTLYVADKGQRRVHVLSIGREALQ
ncbi:hypothetical protein [Pseudodesulfovibrio sp.]|uniref:hypothetical protein n=1 Tax=Pseudodesulfovibrio sp. TaxID=2035812 RepID=UPI00260B36FA|nr:hypothetical protein [Pseudodesulfovibrio sp.]MDD3312411.1 hypothetical protein [Pseudodesulfovibrio sp.]